MKRRIILLLVFCVFSFVLWAAIKEYNQYITPDEFRHKQKVFIMEKAKLTPKEAAEFFPIYFEFQDKKIDLNGRIAQLMHGTKEENIMETQYKELIDKMYELRTIQNKLDKIYYEKFKKVLSYKKIYCVQRAEMHFHRELLKTTMHKENIRKPPHVDRR
ncbi:hypothetical protein EZS27_004304 [termite gut metagenome]|uniref:Periplasmic heavy metal sensor n=1 Tax=termite gut metagenome TaxID=433724 RepID=A0A5J4SQ87_9ZZZZ